MNLEAIPAAIIFAVAFADGLWQTWKLRRTYYAIAEWIQPNRRRIGRAFVVTAALILLPVGWIGFLSIRRLFGLDPIDWSYIVSYLVSLPVLFIPRYLARQWERLG